VTTYFVVDFGDLAAAHDFMNAIAGLGHRSSGVGSRVRITEDTVANLRQQSRDADISIRGITTRVLTSDHDSSMLCVRMGGHAYPVRPDSGAPRIATRPAFTGQAYLD
jgi:hypothetical protein